MSPMGNPKAYLVKGTAIALRDDQASNILIQKIKA
jgi:DtxR family Mn-dependent transcriptional regulator